MRKKILVIDDSALMRRVISDIINSQDEYEVTDVARDGIEGLEKIIANPEIFELIILDINMPKMDGIEVLSRLRESHVRHKTIVVSTVAVEGARETIRALELGAFDFVTKPMNFADVKGGEFSERLLSSIKIALSADELEKDSVTPKEIRTKRPLNVNKTVSLQKGGPDGKIVALACSTGGPKSLQSVIPLLPKNLDAPMLIVQHMPKGFTLSLAQRLNELSEIEVSEAVEGELLLKGHVYIAPGGRHLEIKKNAAGKYIVHLNDSPPIDALRPCANVMYKSLADTDFSEVVCVVMTGMGADGTKGILHLADKKNVHVIAQDAKSCVVYGMPKAIAETGLVNEVLRLEAIAESIIKNTGVS